MWRYFVVLLLVFMPLCGLPLVAVAQTSCADCVVSVTAVDDKYSKVRIVALTGETLRIKSPKLHPDGIPIKRSDLVSIVFPGGNPDAKGIVLKNGLVLNGRAVFLNNQWTIHIDGLDGEMLLGSDEILSINFRQEALIVPQKDGGDWQYNASFKVTEWIYSSEGSALPAGVAYSFDIEKLVLAGNKLEVLGHLYSGSGTRHDCSMECILSDDKGYRYESVKTKLGHIPKKAAKMKISMDCPLPDVSAEVVTIKIRNSRYCGNTQWQELPAFNLRLLKPSS